ncbi:Crp/Fnr family transcriptional regulator [Methylobacterium durans]|uniref:Crp/Fnr family transcriptional regulator n=1 Tax=Methylobacterium durans TaxID=2202825 RepID=A0A2U8WHG0_9HYPH|nr:Crp/Fnr family transcriptional regulator [Methylobacterium durans]
MPDPLTRRLAHAGHLSETEQEALRELTLNARSVAARRDIAAPLSTETVHLVLSGIACRYKILLDGTRRIVSYLLPGDLCDVHAGASGAADWSVGTLTPCSVADIPRERLADLARTHPGIDRALRWITLTELSAAREWLANDSRPADRRIAHLFCELLVRLQAVDLAGASSVDLRLSQVDLADTAGISFVHVNRVLQSLRASGLIVSGKHMLTIPDVARLQAFAEFDSGYLHLAQ